MIHAENLFQVYGETVALREVSFDIPRGQIVGLVGPNGAGKTTAMKILTGYLAPTRGRARVGGHDVVEERLEAQRLIGYLPENAPLYREMLVQDYLLYMARLREVPPPDRVPRLRAVVDACSIREVMNRPVGHLSKGYRQRVGLAQAMVHDPAVLILDEPTSGLDPTQILEIREVIRRTGREKTVILSTHILSEVEATCDRAIMIVGGRVHRDDSMDSFRRGHAIVVRIQGEVPDAAAALARIEGVTGTEEVPDRDGNTALRLMTDAREGLLQSIGALARERGWTLGELTREHHDLEDIFRQLDSRQLEGREEAA